MSARATAKKASSGAPELQRNGREAGNDWPRPEESPAEFSKPAVSTAPTIGGGAEPAALFDRFRQKALDTDRARFASLEGSSLVAIEGNTIRIGAPAAFHVERLRQRIADLETLAAKLFGRPTRITVEIAAPSAQRVESNQSREHSRKRRQEALNSESVNMAIEVLEAEIVEIRPLGENR